MDKIIGGVIAIAILVFIFVYVIAYIVTVIAFIVFVIPTYIILFLYVVLEFFSTNILIALDKIFYPGFNVSPLVIWAFWGLVIGAVIQGYREMRIYGQKQKGVLIAFAPVALLAILKLISPPGLGFVEVYSPSSPVTARRPPSPPPPVRQDDHGNTRSSATSLTSLGSAWSGEIKPGSDVDYFKVQVSKSGVLTVYTTGNLDTRGTLENSSGTTLVRNLDDGSENNFKIEQSVRAGTYYIKVESYRAYTGSYTIHTSFREQSPQRVADDHSNTLSGATSLALGGSRSRSGQINPGSDIDYFKIQVSKSGVLTVYTTSILDTRGVLQNSSGTTLAGDDDAGSNYNFLIEHRVNAGTYYIKVDSHNNSVGSYTIHTSFREQSPQRVADDHSNTLSGATSLALGGSRSRSGQINPGSDIDYFKIQVSKSGVLTVYTTSILDTRGVLQNSSGTVLTDDDDAGSGNNFKIERSVSSGTYYIKVESYKETTGSYTIHTSFREQRSSRLAESPSVPKNNPSARKDDHSNTRSGATSLALGDSRPGRIEPGGDVDYFKVQVTRSGVLTVYTAGRLDTRGVLYNSSGTALTGDDDAGSGNNFKIEHRVNVETYYIKVDSHNNSVGSYTVRAYFR